MKRMNLGGKWKVFSAVLLAIAVIVGGGTLWYHGYYTKTPEYAVRMIEEAVASHDEAKFDRYVDMRKLTETAGNEFLEAAMDADSAMTEEARSAVSGFAQIIDKAGFYQSEIRGKEGLEKNADDGRATLGLRIYQKEAAEEFVLQIRFEKGQDGVWKAAELSNFRDFVAFVTKARKEQFRAYLKKTEDIIRAHEDKVGAADKKLVDILHSGSMGDMNVRRQMRAVMVDEILPDWQLRRSELEAVEPPTAAQTLHRLRLRICDMRISYAISYAEWLETKKAVDIQKANEILKEARTLEQEAETMSRRMTRGTM